LESNGCVFVFRFDRFGVAFDRFADGADLSRLGLSADSRPIGLHVDRMMRADFFVGRYSPA
jgi:hypothetical protein